MKQKYAYLLLMILLVAFSACKKNVPLAPLPQNKILEFKVANLPDTVIYGAVNQLSNTVTVYLPVFYGIALIDPVIKVSEGAQLTEAVSPVGVYNQEKTYTVKAADGSTNTYKLKIQVLNPVKLNVSWPSQYIVNNACIAYPNSIGGTGPILIGNFNASGSGLAIVNIKNRLTGKTVTLGGSNILFRSNGSYDVTSDLSATIDTGYYDVNIKYFDQETSPKEPLHIIHRQPDLLIPVRLVKKGETISFTAFNSIFLGLKSVRVKLDNKDSYNLPIVSYTPVEMTLKIPDDFPVGVYDYTAQYTFEFENWKSVTKSGSLTVVAK